MIGKIFRFKDYDENFVYFKIIKIYNDRIGRGKVIKSNMNNTYYKIGIINDFYYDEGEVISEEKFNKIMVFE